MASLIPSVATSGALAGVRVVDMSRLLPGPLATQFLADFGAEVIKVEDTDGGDYGACSGDWHDSMSQPRMLALYQSHHSI